MALTPKPASLDRRLAKFDERLRKLETRRVLSNASIPEGGIYVKAPTSDAGSIHLWVQTQAGTSSHDATLDFQPSNAAVFPARMRMQDDGPTPSATNYPLTMRSAASVVTAEDASYLTISPGFLEVRSSASSRSVSRGLSLNDGQPAYLNGWAFDAATLDAPSNSLRWQAAAGEWRALNTSNAYVAVRASSFPTSSSKAAKQNIDPMLPFDPATVIADAPVYGWQYRQEMAQDTARHYFPMADDLPAVLVQGEGEQMSVDTRDLLGVVWAAMRDTLAANASLNDRVAKLEQQNQTLAAKLGLKL